MHGGLKTSYRHGLSSTTTVCQIICVEVSSAHAARLISWAGKRVQYWVDHGSRGWYDNPQSALKPVQVGPLHKAPSVCKECVFIDGAWQLLVTACVSLLGEPAVVCL